MEKEIKDKIKLIESRLGKYLKTKLKKGKFPLENNYGEIFLAGIMRDKDILKAYLNKNKADFNFHWEFNNYILQQLDVNEKQFQIYRFNQLFFKKVTNWIFLRGLILLRSKNWWRKIKGNLMITITLLINQKNGFLSDNRIYARKKYSNQYHAFAVALLGEIYLENKRYFYKKRFGEAMGKLKELCVSVEKFNNGNRGSRQIFGYSSAIYALNLGDKILGTNSSKEIDRLVNELSKFQRKDGSIPLCLTKEEFRFIEKDYMKERSKIKGWESYNRYYDYLGFSCYFLKKSIAI